MRYLKSIITVIKEAFKATLATKSRAILSAICIGIGIASVTVVVSLGAAALNLVNKYLDMYGADAAMIISWNPKSRREMTLTVKDVDGLRANFPDAYLVAPHRFHPSQPISYMGANIISEVDAINLTVTDEWNWKIGKGRDFSEHDIDFTSNVCIIGDYIREVFFDQDNAIGKQIKVGRTVCEVIGVADKKTLGGLDSTANTFVMLPSSTFVKKFGWFKTHLFMIRMRFYDPAIIDKQMKNVEDYLRHSHNLKDGDKNDFMIFTPSTISAMLYAVLAAIGAFLGVITMVIVVVGGFVTANLFMLATQTRIKEIGIRRAFGATRSDIFKQFIAEFSVTILLGMLVGITIAWIATKIISSFDIVEVSITPGVFTITAVMSVIIALTFGILPARSAARTRPIEAMRTS